MSDNDWDGYNEIFTPPPADPGTPPPAARSADDDPETGPLPPISQAPPPRPQHGPPPAPSTRPTPPWSGEPPRPPAGWPQPPHHTAPQRPPGSHRRDHAELLGRLTPQTLAPPPPPTPSRGWRKVVVKSTAGLVNPGLSTAEEQLRADIAAITGPLRGDCYKIGVFVGKGGTGKSTVAALLGTVFAEYRSEDRVIALDVDPSFGKLAHRIAPQTTQTYWDLLADAAAGGLQRWTDVKTHLGANSDSGLWLLRGEHRTESRRLIDGKTYTSAMRIIDRYMNLAIIDCGQVLEHPVMEAVLPTLSAAVVVGAMEPGAGQAAGETLAWLSGAGYHRLISHTVVVLNDPRGRASKGTRTALEREFRAHTGGATVVMPFDDYLSTGGVIENLHALSPRTRRRGIELAAQIAAGFGATNLEARRR